MAKRRGNQEGSISKTASGKWRAQISLDGKRPSKTFDTQKEAQAWIKKMRGLIDQGLTYDGTTRTVGEFVDGFIENKRDGLELSTYEQYKDYTRQHIQPALGRCKFKDLTPSRVQSFYNNLREQGTGKRTIQITHTILRSALDQALKEGLLSFNPADRAQLPRTSFKEMEFYDESQVSSLLAAIQGKRNEHLYALVIATGVRLGEVTALKWSDVDWTPGEEAITVQRAIVWKKTGGFLLKAPKTKYSRRSIGIGADMVRRLRAQLQTYEALRAAAGEKWQDHGLVFPAAGGGPQSRSTIDKEFDRYLAEAGLPKIRFHDLRHTFVALMINLDPNIYKISRMLGHASAGFTLTRYGHLLPDKERKAAAYMDTITAPASLEIE